MKLPVPVRKKWPKVSKLLKKKQNILPSILKRKLLRPLKKLATAEIVKKLWTDQLSHQVHHPRGRWGGEY